MRRHYYRWRERVLARIQGAALRRLERRADFLSWRVERHLMDRHQYRIADLSTSLDRLELAVADHSDKFARARAAASLRDWQRCL